MEKILIELGEVAIKFDGKQVAGSEWKIDSLNLTGFVRVYFTQDGRLVTYSEQSNANADVEKNYHISLISELQAVKSRGYFAKLIFGDQLHALRNELRQGMPTEMEFNDVIKTLATQVANKLDHYAT